jgi:ribosomal protein S3
MLKRLSFWKYRLIFRYLKFLLRHVFRPNFHLFDFRGVKLRLKGKISVAGNARTRTLFLRVGDTSHSKANNRVAYDLSYIHTFTGVMGFKL